jgi:hypothetical protein
MKRDLFSEEGTQFRINVPRIHNLRSPLRARRALVGRSPLDCAEPPGSALLATRPRYALCARSDSGV